MNQQLIKPRQFEIWRSFNTVTNCEYNPDNKGYHYYTFKPGPRKTIKDLFFIDAFNWFSSYEPDEKVERIKFQLQSCHYNINNNKYAILMFFRNLKKLKKHHFENYNFYRFLGSYKFHKWIKKYNDIGVHNELAYYGTTSAPGVEVSQ